MSGLRRKIVSTWNRLIDTRPSQPHKTGKMPVQKKVNAAELITKGVDAVLHGKSFKKATNALSQQDADKLSRALGMTVDQFRTEFADQLRAGASEALALLRAKLDQLKPGELAFALSVMTDKANALEARGSTLSTSVNQQVNNFYVMDKQALLDSLHGKRPAKPSPIPVDPILPPTPPLPPNPPQITPIDPEPTPTPLPSNQ